MVSSCVAHALSSILEYHDQGQHKLSTNFIYGIKRYLYNDDQPGMYLTDACKIALKYGDLLETDCPGNDEIPYCYKKAEKILENSEKLQSAQKYRINSYYKCNSINDIKLAIYKYGPVLLSVKWFHNLRVNNLTGEISYNIDNDFGYHCVMCYGWNKQGLLCKNSYGILWGLNGTFILPYDYPEINDARAIIDYIDNVEENKELIITPTYNKLQTMFIKIYNFLINILKYK